MAGKFDPRLIVKTLARRAWLLALLAVVPQVSARAGGFKAGAAAVLITPAIGTPLAGYYALRPATGVLDDLYAKALVVEQDGAKAVFVTLDVVTVTRTMAVAARRLIAEQTGITPERVMISATHTHSGPVIKRNGMLDQLTGADQPLAVEFNEKLPALIARAAREANAKLAPARPSAAVGGAEGLTRNRRSWMQDGTVAWQPPKNDQRIVRPAGPVDPEVGVWHVAPLATYVNFPMHANIVGGTRFSADFPAVLARQLALAKGADMITLFANGCCGNINPDKTIAGAGSSPVERVGMRLAAAVTNAWKNLRPLKTFAPRARHTVLVLPRPHFSEADAAEARSVAAHMNDRSVGTVTKAKAFCILDTVAHKDEPLEAEVQAIAVSDDLAIVAMPGEIFSEVGLAIKKASPFKHTFIAEPANGSIGYVPNRAAYAEGNYEVVSARCAAGSGEMLVDAAVKLLREMVNAP
jgi:neutral ceramidase